LEERLRLRDFSSLFRAPPLVTMVGIDRFIPKCMRVPLYRIQWWSENPVYNEMVLRRLYRATFLKGRPKRLFGTDGSDTYLVDGSKGAPYEVILGKKECRGSCSCEDFERNVQYALKHGQEFVMPCKHLLKVLFYRRSVRK